MRSNWTQGALALVIAALAAGCNVGTDVGSSQAGAASTVENAISITTRGDIAVEACTAHGFIDISAGADLSFIAVDGAANLRLALYQLDSSGQLQQLRDIQAVQIDAALLTRIRSELSFSGAQMTEDQINTLQAGLSASIVADLMALIHVDASSLSAEELTARVSEALHLVLDARITGTAMLFTNLSSACMVSHLVVGVDFDATAAATAITDNLVVFAATASVVASEQFSVSLPDCVTPPPNCNTNATMNISEVQATANACSATMQLDLKTTGEDISFIALEASFAAQLQLAMTAIDAQGNRTVLSNVSALQVDAALLTQLRTALQLDAVTDMTDAQIDALVAGLDAQTLASLELLIGVDATAAARLEAQGTLSLALRFAVRLALVGGVQGQMLVVSNLSAMLSAQHLLLDVSFTGMDLPDDFTSNVNIIAIGSATLISEAEFPVVFKSACVNCQP